jgi:hypothetical protein
MIEEERDDEIGGDWRKPKVEKQGRVYLETRRPQRREEKRRGAQKSMSHKYFFYVTYENITQSHHYHT